MMMMPLFTHGSAIEMVGGSEDWAIGLEASIRKWEQIVSGDEESYERTTRCGLCFVASNRLVGCSSCPADDICNYVKLPDTAPEEILEMLLEIDLEQE